MPVKLKDCKRAETLFGDWPEGILKSCLQGIMGCVYADYAQQPESAMAMLGDFCFLAGRPDEELVRFKPDECSGDFMIMVPQSKGWAAIITEVYKDKAKPVARYAFRKEPGVFDRQKLRTAVDSLSSEYTVRMMDEECFDECRRHYWSRDLVSQFTDYEMYQRLGLGTVVLRQKEIVAGASSYASFQGGIEIEIDTKEEYRRQGLAYACGAALLLECMDRGIYPSWDAQNLWSVALAEKLGYHFDHEYTVYEIWGYGDI